DDDCSRHQRSGRRDWPRPRRIFRVAGTTSSGRRCPATLAGGRGQHSTNVMNHGARGMRLTLGRKLTGVFALVVAIAIAAALFASWSAERSRAASSTLENSYQVLLATNLADLAIGLQESSVLQFFARLEETLLAGYRAEGKQQLDEAVDRLSRLATSDI